MVVYREFRLFWRQKYCLGAKCNKMAIDSSSIMSKVGEKLTEKKLLFEIITRKDPESYAKLYDLYVERIYRFIYFKVSSKDEAQDLTADVFLKTWEYLTANRIPRIKSVSGLLYRVARNRVIDRYRERARKPTTALEEIESAVLVDYTKAVEAKEDVRLLLDQIKGLKREYQEVIMLRFIEEMSIAEIAQAMDKTQTNVRVLIHRATKRLKQ